MKETDTASPFVVLSIAPTTDVAAIERAYFAALGRHPPHADPEGFRRLRGAYETLMSPDGLRAAVARAPLDREAELARYRQRYDARLAAAAAAVEGGPPPMRSARGSGKP